VEHLGIIPNKLLKSTEQTFGKESKSYQYLEILASDSIIQDDDMLLTIM